MFYLLYYVMLSCDQNVKVNVLIASLVSHKKILYKRSFWLVDVRFLVCIVSVFMNSTLTSSAFLFSFFSSQHSHCDILSVFKHSNFIAQSRQLFIIWNVGGNYQVQCTSNYRLQAHLGMLFSSALINDMHSPENEKSFFEWWSYQSDWRLVTMSYQLNWKYRLQILIYLLVTY